MAKFCERQIVRRCRPVLSPNWDQPTIRNPRWASFTDGPIRLANLVVLLLSSNLNQKVDP
jgi:hypothetical protein